MKTNNNDMKYSVSIIFQIASFLTFRIVHILITIALPIIYRIRIKGRRNTWGIKKAIVISNHLIYLDPAVVTYAMGHKRLMYATLEETCNIPILGTYIQLLGSFPVPRNDPWNIAEPVSWSLRKNRYVHFYPEGSLTLNSQKLKKFKKGAFHFAIENDVPIIPATIVIKPNKYMNWKVLKELFKVIVVVSKPLYPTDFYNEGMTDEDHILAMMTYSHTLMQRILDSYNTPSNNSIDMMNKAS